MRHSLILSFLGWLTAALSLSMALPMMAAFLSGEGRAGILFASTMMISSFGAGLMIFTGRQSGRVLTQADLCLVAVLGWGLGIFVAALPLWAILDLPIAKIYFLSASALTTTGATIFTDPGTLEVSVRLWLAFLQWFGGLATLVMAMMVLAPLGVGGMSLRLVAGTASEQNPDRGFIRALQIIGPLYAGLTFLCAALLFIGGVPFFESVCMAFSTLSTGGMNPGLDQWVLNAPYVKFVLAIFMLIGAMNMAQYYLLLRGRATFRQDLERRVFLALVVVSAVALGVLFFDTARAASEEEVTSVFAGGWGELILDSRWRDALGEGFFVGISVISTTGWAAEGLQIPFIFTLLLTFIGGMTISTAGGLKVLRILLLLRQSRKELSLLVHPHDVKGVYFDGTAIHIPLMQTVWVFFALFNASVAVLMLVLAFTGLSFEHSLAASVAAIANAGPMVNMVGIDAAKLYASLPDAASWAMSLGMIGGRVELLALISIVSPIYWTRS